MDYQKVLIQIQEGSKSQRRRKKELDLQKKQAVGALQKKTKNAKKNAEAEQKLQDIITAQLRYIAKIREGNANSMRTISIRLFFLKFQNKELAMTLKSTEQLMQKFQDWLNAYEKIIQKKDWKEEEQCNKELIMLLKEYEKEKKRIEKIKKQKQEVRDKATATLLLLLLTATILLFKDTKEIAYDPEIFGEKNRWNPLNPFFPLRA